MYGKKVVRFVPWHLQSTLSESSDVELRRDDIYIFDVDSPQAEEWFRRWKEKRTGFPWIDALMRQLKQKNGFIIYGGIALLAS
jgi:cryptochrome